MMEAKQVLVTGSAGRLGRAAVRALLRAGHVVRGFDRVPTPGLSRDQYLIADLHDLDQLHQAILGIDCLIHLAATPDDARFPRGEPPHDGDNFLRDLVPNNIIGPYQILEAARRAAVPRVILASTGQVVDGHLRANNIPVTTHTLPQPRYLYACTKVFLEALGQVYASQHNLSVLAVRLGWCPRDLRQVQEIQQSPLAQDVYLSPNDAGHFFTCTVQADAWKGYRMVYATSRPVHQLRYDLEPARKLVGYEPREQWPCGAEDFSPGE